jgi:TatA/E family protein of Tat protein translocase
MLAIFESLGFSELMIVLVAAILIFGKRLPEVASQAGQQIAKFRRSLQDIKTETGIDNDIRKIQREIQQAVPRDLSMGEMARIASIELEKRIKANDEPIKDVAKPAGVIDTSGVVTKAPSTSTVSLVEADASAHASPDTSAEAPARTLDRASSDNSAHAATEKSARAPAAQPSDAAADSGAHP